MTAINKIAQQEGLEDFSKLRCDVTAVETNIHYPTNNVLMWDCIKTFDRLLMKLRENSGGAISVRRYKKRAKKHCGKINNTKSAERRKALFEKQLKLLRTSINQAERAVATLTLHCAEAARVLTGEISVLLPKAEKVYAMTYRHEILGECVPNEENLFSIYEEHSELSDYRLQDIGRQSKDTQAYGGVIDRVKENSGVVPRDMATDGGYASLANQRLARQAGIVNIVFNKIVGSLKNLTSSLNMETRLKKWRSGMEAVISNLKRGVDIFRCGWKTRTYFDAKVYWSALAYNIRVMTDLLIGRMQIAR